MHCKTTLMSKVRSAPHIWTNLQPERPHISSARKEPQRREKVQTWQACSSMEKIHMKSIGTTVHPQHLQLTFHSRNFLRFDMGGTLLSEQCCHLSSSAFISCFTTGEFDFKAIDGESLWWGSWDCQKVLRSKGIQNRCTFGELPLTLSLFVGCFSRLGYRSKWPGYSKLRYASKFSALWHQVFILRLSLCRDQWRQRKRCWIQKCSPTLTPYFDLA